MELRGAAPASVCPRCGAEQPPTDEPLAHCATCKLAYDPKVEPVVRVRRASESKELVPAPRGITISRQLGEVTVRWTPRRAIGVGAMLLGLVCAVVWLGNRDTPGEDPREMALLFGGAIGLLFAGASTAFREVVLRVDERRVSVRRTPLALGRRVEIERREIDRVVLLRSDGESSLHRVCAVTRRGAIVVASFERSQLDRAQCVKEVIDEALRGIEPA